MLAHLKISLCRLYLLIPCAPCVPAGKIESPPILNWMWSAIHPTSPLLRHPNKECVAGWEDIRGISWDLIQGMERGGISWNWTTRPHIIYISYQTHIMSYPRKGVNCGDQSPGTPRKNNWWQDLVVKNSCDPLQGLRRWIFHDSEKLWLRPCPESVMGTKLFWSICAFH